MVNVNLCDSCDKIIYGCCYKWKLAATLQMMEGDVDLCKKCWEKYSYLIRDKISEKYKEGEDK